MLIEKRLFQPSTPGNVWFVLKMSIPLILASAAHSINLFVDRLMLQTYSQDAMSAAFPAGLTSFALMCYFVGTVGYANAFVAQYFGAKMYHRVGASIWQAIYMALLGGLFSAATYFIAEPMFDFFGHDPRLRADEAIYFQILALGGFLPLLSIALCSFWGGQGKTNMVMLFDLIIMLANIPLNWIFIFGCDWGFFHIPKMGVAGAAYGTVGASAIGSAAMLLCFFGGRTNVARYRTWNAKLDWDLFLRLFKFGGPNGIQLFLDLAAFNAFVILIGKIGADEMNASGVAFSLNSLAMIPMFGLGQTVSILVGQGIGAHDIPYAERAVKSARFWLYSVLLIVCFLFIFLPEPSLHLFKLEEGTRSFYLAKIMLRLIAAYMFFDATAILYGASVKGAGDTKFCMWIGATYAWFLYGFPCLIVYYVFTRPSVTASMGLDRANAWNLWSLWGFCVFYIMAFGVTAYLRYRSGKWKKMQVIENAPADVR